MKKHEILSLQHSEKKDWLIRNVSDYKLKAFYGDLIGCIINVSDDHMEEYVSYPESYETGSVIKKEYPELSTIREEEINSGAPLTKQEIEILKSAIIELQAREAYAGVNFTVCNFACDDGEVFVTFSGIFEGPADVDWSFDNIFATKTEAVKSVSHDRLETDDYFFPI